MTQLSPSQRSALRRWRRLIGRFPAALKDAQNRVCVHFRSRACSVDGLVNTDQLTAVVVSSKPTDGADFELRVAEYVPQHIPWGVQWGGADQCRSIKNLRLRPRQRARGERFDLNSPRLLHDILDLCDTLRCAKPAVYTEDLHLPDLWAAFSVSDSHGIEGDGPELIGRMHEAGLSARELMRRYRREFRGHVCWPACWVSHEWLQFAGVFADVSSASSIQVVQAADLQSALTGFRGACAFDFSSGRSSQQEPGQPRRPHLAA